ncbi:unnamed protein product [Moneuplotes crassus]|uniref:Uncharacterized protein n=1 Tax=Euplotes crassus TaxID=5936 RepID=A0AAD1XDL9_EUPCR|nr:unnamed protein product [Moneuplotes crassus]
MNQFIHFDPFSSSNSFALEGEIPSFQLLEEPVNPSYKLNQHLDDFIGMGTLKGHQLLRGPVEDELPKFHFPTPESLVMPEKVDNKEKELNDTKSVNSTKSATRANMTKDSSCSAEFSKNLSNFDIYFEEIAQLQVKEAPQKDQGKANNSPVVPTLEDIFNLKKSEKVPEKSLDKIVDDLIQTKKPMSNKQDLSKRGDVVNKTILRAMKRYYLTEFDSLYDFSSLSDKEKFQQFHELVRKYVTQEMGICENLTTAELEDTILFFGSMISHIHMRRGITVSKIRTQVNSVHKCLYSYSHKKLSQLMKQGGFKFVLEDFVHHEKIDIVLNSEETMLKQQDLYRDACVALLLKCQE